MARRVRADTLPGMLLRAADCGNSSLAGLTTSSEMDKRINELPGIVSFEVSVGLIREELPCNIAAG